MSKTILFIVEGENRDYRFVNNMTGIFLSGKYKTEIINVPAEQNLYMLYQILKEDDFDTDLIEVIRDIVPGAKEKLEGILRQDVDEIYMFFDYDIHQDNYHSDEDIVSILLDTFNNETENGKLYISYPMVEALYDYKDGECESFTGCCIKAEEVKDYKELAGKNNPKSGLHLKYKDWETILELFSIRVMCLYKVEEISFDIYKQQVFPLSIYNIEKEILEKEGFIFVLSAFPEFLFDYFKADFWNSHYAKKNRKYNNCVHKPLKD